MMKREEIATDEHRLYTDKRNSTQSRKEKELRKGKNEKLSET